MRLGYIRVSTAEQNEARQEVLMKQLGVEKVFIDKQTGTNTDRPALKEMMMKRWFYLHSSIKVL